MLVVFGPLLLIAAVREGWGRRERFSTRRVKVAVGVSALVLLGALELWQTLGPDRIDRFEPEKGMSQAAAIDALETATATIG